MSGNGHLDARKIRGSPGPPIVDADGHCFRDFMLANAVRSWGEVNPDVFKGTVVEKPAAELLAVNGGRA